jgi:hypothetical protein
LQYFQELTACHLTILALTGLKEQKTKPLLPRYNKESQKTFFSQAKVPACASAPGLEGKKRQNT